MIGMVHDVESPIEVYATGSGVYYGRVIASFGVHGWDN
jgi:hypothetical protein